MRNFTDGFRQPKQGMWALDWVNFRSPVPEAPRFNVPWKWLGIAAAFGILGFLFPWEWAALYGLPLFGMAQQSLPYGQSDNDPVVANRLTNREAWKRTGEMFSDLYSLQSSITNAGDFGFSGELMDEEKIDAAIASALTDGDDIVFIPANLLPYDVSLLTNLAAFTAAGGRLVREGGDFSVHDVLAYGAAGTGVLDDTMAVQAALSAASAVGGGVVFLPVGTFLVSPRVHPLNADWAVCLIIPNGVVLSGAGVFATTIKLAVVVNAIPTGCNANWKLQITSVANPPGGNNNISIRDLTIDGNAINQTFVPPDSAHGISFNRVRGGRIANVVVKNLYGEGPGPPGETTHFEADRSADIYYTACEAYSDDGGATASGFSANHCTSIEYSGCSTWGMFHGQGFTNWTSALIRYANCHAYLNGYIGFNTEISEHISYVGCHSGGRAANDDGIFTAQQNLGNSVGFRILGSSFVVISGGSASYNTANEGYGIQVKPYAGPINSTDIAIDGVALVGNKYGVWVDDASQARVELTATCRITGNTTGAFGGTGNVNTLSRTADSPIEEWTASNGTSGVRFNVTGAGSSFAYRWLVNGAERMRLVDTGALGIMDGITSPTAVSGLAFLYVDTADGDLKIKFGDGTIKTIVVDT